MNDTALISAARQGDFSTTLTIPTLIKEAGPRVQRRFVEFFTANIRNPNTRAAYARAVARFVRWCELRRVTLDGLEPTVVAAYIDELGSIRSKAMVKQHLAAIKTLCNFLVTGGALPVNPAASVRGPRLVMVKGKTPVLSAEDCRQLIDSIDVLRPAGLRDRALIGLMVYSFARIGAVLQMNVDDYYQNGKRWWIRLHEKGGR